MFTYYASYGNTYQKGIIEGTNYNRNNFNVSSTAKFSEKLKSDFSVNFSRVRFNGTSEGGRPFEGLNAYANAIQSPVNIPFNELRDYESPFHDLNGYYGSYTVNPFFILGTHRNDAEINNILGNLSLTYSPIEGLDFIGRVGANVVQRTLEQVIPKYAYGDHYAWENDLGLSQRTARHSDLGLYSNLQGVNTNLDITAMANYTKDFGANNDFNIRITPGYNFFQSQRSSVEGSTQGGLIIPEFYNISNSAQTPLAAEVNDKRRIFGVFANANLGWRNMLFAEYSLRNDWSSTLPLENNSFFYQAGGLSVVLTEIGALKNNDWLNYLKIRTNVGTTGKDAPVYLTQSTYLSNPQIQSLGGGFDLIFPFNGQAGITVDNLIGNAELKPELTLTGEVGLDLALFKNRLSVEYTWYKSKHTDQIVRVDLPSTSGYSRAALNIGEITNQGHELSATIRPVVGVKDFSWDITYLFAKNVNEVVKVADDVDEISYLDWRGVSIVAKEGFPLGTFKALDWKRNDDGQLVVDPTTGIPLDAEEADYFESYQPKFTSSFGTNLGYKGLAFNILFDVKVGGSFTSVSQFYTEFNGTAVTTLLNDREDFVVENSVIETTDDEGNVTGYEENTQAVVPYDYFNFRPPAAHINDASFVKLRELGLKYSLPSKVFKNVPISGMSIGFVARNVKFWLPDENVWADPEVTGPALNGNGSGIETAQTPPTRSYGFNLNLNF